jgi:hypothetical protein
MSFTISYQSLFTLDLLHHFFLDEGTVDFADLPVARQALRQRQYQVGRFFRIQADAATRSVMAGARMRLVEQPHGFRIVIQVGEDSRPLLRPDDDLVLRFGLFLQDPLFWNYTALRLQNSFAGLPVKNDVRRLFYFSNTVPFAGAPAPALPHLNRPTAAFVAGGDYQMGDRVAVGTDRFEARRDINSSPAPGAPGSGWQPLSPARDYVGRQDEIRFRGPTFNYHFTQPNITADLLIRDGAERVVWSETGVQSFPDHRSYRVHPKGLQPGYYRLEVDDGGGYQETQPFFYHPDWFGTSLFGVIEIKLPGLLDDGSVVPADAGKLLSPQYALHFRPRSTIWRYRSARDQSVIPAITGNDDPLPLTQAGDNPGVLLNAHPLPRPGPDKIVPVATDAVIYSDIYIDEQFFA